MPIVPDSLPRWLERPGAAAAGIAALGQHIPRMAGDASGMARWGISVCGYSPIADRLPISWRHPG